jgi:hypothetical protein
MNNPWKTMQTEDQIKNLSKETMAQDNVLSFTALVAEQRAILARTLLHFEVPCESLHRSQRRIPTMCESSLERENSGFSV